MFTNIIYTVTIILFVTLWSMMIDQRYKNNLRPKMGLAVLIFMFLMVMVHVYDIHMINIYLNEISYVRTTIWFLLIYLSMI